MLHFIQFLVVIYNKYTPLNHFNNMLYASYISKNSKTSENGTHIKMNTALNEKIQDPSRGKRNTIIDIISVMMESYLSYTLEFRY